VRKDTGGLQDLFGFGGQMDSMGRNGLISRSVELKDDLDFEQSVLFFSFLSLTSVKSRFYRLAGTIVLTLIWQLIPRTLFFVSRVRYDSILDWAFHNRWDFDLGFCNI
jgi:hypothetical protein